MQPGPLAVSGLGAYTGESSHGATMSVYGADPDGPEFEVMWMLPRSAWGDYAGAAPVEHLDLPGEVIRWAGVGTAPRPAGGEGGPLPGVTLTPRRITHRDWRVGRACCRSQAHH